MHRHLGTLVVALIFALSSTFSVASAQAATGTLVGHVTFCKLAPRPAGQTDADPSLLADVTPGLAHAVAGPIKIPAVAVQVGILGTGPSTTTDASGGFTLSGVPAAQPLTLVVTASAGPPLMLAAPSLQVSAGQTRDLGSVGLAGCGDASAVLVEAPAAPAVDGPGQPGEQPEPGDLAAPPADQTDPAPMTDGSN
jgi:hypothetical protein